MANINYSITTDPSANPILEGFTWTGTLSNITAASTVNSSKPTSVSGTANGETITFNVDATNGYNVYPSETGDNYITFRSQNIASQYPTSGFSLDIWSLELYNQIVGGATWNDLQLNSPYNLNNGKYSLFYNYNGPNASFWCRGGKISFAVA